MSNPLPEDQVARLQEYIFSRRKIEAIKFYRELTGVGLKEAKDEVEQLEASLQNTFPEKFTASAKGKGCAGAAAILCLSAAGLVYWLAS